MTRRGAAGIVLLLAAAGLSGAASTEAPGLPEAAIRSIAAEPSATLNVGARLLALTGQGGSSRALVELNIFSRLELSELSLSWSRDGGEAVAMDLPAAHGKLKAWSARKVQIPVDLSEGDLHHVTFLASGLDARGNALRSSATVTVNLDPSRRPERLDVEDRDLIQFRPATGGM